MISIKSSFYSSDKWLAFPGFLVSLKRLTDNSRIEFLVNRPGLEQCFVVIETNSPNKNLSYFVNEKYPKLSDIQFGRYTIISVATQGKLNRKLTICGVYSRSSYIDSLRNLKWVSAKYHWSSHKVAINSIESPILIFDSSRVNHLVWDWCSAFISFLAFGFLSIDVLYGSFSLGKTTLRFHDLLEE